MWIDEGNIYLCNVENGYAGEVFICYMLYCYSGHRWNGKYNSSIQSTKCVVILFMVVVDCSKYKILECVHR
jgi:hypothetical protein